MKTFVMRCTLLALFSHALIMSCPICVDRISDLQEPFFAMRTEQNKKIEASHE